MGNLDKDLLKEIMGISVREDSYIAGMSKIRFYGVKGGEIKVSLYDPLSPDDFLKDSQGRRVQIYRKWGSLNEGNVYRFLDGCVIDWPSGFATINIIADSVSIEFDTDSMVSIKDYNLNPDKYSF
ncbi:hypothetical protein [Lihuaxuella thermophila]|uniref:hypothetical protein n=1 Tax=Lihuaxuella thermophila TaxID=1173111 RepID=UPI000B7FE70A|nr:hypothetical protein [Lihuaxuella thermophila]